MSWLNNPPFGVDEAQQRGVDVYEVLVSNWGGMNGFIDPDERSIQWPPPGTPPIPVSLAGIAIGPRSTVDRCWVSYNLQKSKIVSNGEVTSVTNRIRRLSVDSPLIFTQAAKRGVMYNPAKDLVQEMPLKGMLQIFAYANSPTTTYNWTVGNIGQPQDNTIFPASFVAADGGSYPLDFDTLPFINLPLLHLYLYLKAPPSYVPVKRFPLQCERNGPLEQGIQPYSAESPHIVGTIPVYGRKSINIMMIGVPSNVGGATSFDFRIGAIRGINPSNPNYEQPVDQALGIAPNTPVVLSPCAGGNFNADLLNLYITPRGGTGTVIWNVTAYD